MRKSFFEFVIKGRNYKENSVRVDILKLKIYREGKIFYS